MSQVEAWKITRVPGSICSILACEKAAFLLNMHDATEITADLQLRSVARVSFFRLE